MTYRHAVKDADNNVPFGETLPVHYNALAGLTVEETESLQDYDVFPVVGSGVFEGVEGTGRIFRDMIQVQDAEVLFHYADAFYLEFAAVTRKLNRSPSSRQLKKYKFFLPVEIYLLAVFMQLASKFHVFPLALKFQDSFASVYCCSNLYNLRSFLREYLYQ